MKIVVFGATGGAGQEFVTQALQAGHEVTAVARDPAKVSARHERLKQTVSGLQESLDYLRLSIKYLVFDLEATRRENGYLRDTPPFVDETMITREVPAWPLALSRAALRSANAITSAGWGRIRMLAGLPALKSMRACSS